MSVYTSALTAQDASALTLTPNEQFALITDVQNVPTTVTVQDDGTEYVTYGVTPESEAAGARLLAAFWPAITKAARSSKLKGREDEAQSVALEAFVRAVREYDLTSDTPFHHTLPGRLRHAVLEDDRTVNPAGLSIPPVAVARYHRMMHRYNDDAVSAYAAASAARDTEGAGLLSKASFLAIHHAVTGGMSLDWTAPGDDSGEFTEWARNESGWKTDDNDMCAAASVSSHEDAILSEDYGQWLLSQVTDRQESVCRLKYGFQDDATEALRTDHGYRLGEVLEDMQVADCLGMTRPTVQREKSKALQTMRSAIESEIAAEEA